MNAENHENPEEDQNPDEFVAELVEGAEPGLPDEGDQHQHADADTVDADAVVDAESAEVPGRSGRGGS